MSKKLLRTVKLSPDVMTRIRAELESYNPDWVAKLVASLIGKLSLKREQAWDEIRHAAGVNPEAELCKLSCVTNEILVYARDADDDESEEDRP